ncbi:efflux RND transporter periplasmic adaptor subunit [Dyadobacter fermentans]|uniref:Efflux transporter, RND family, MFP subunit n=1 Tax=Dyadobacter fermentans (strain ATCC 700827 / DSM 18053 / CIP 107007 / KCTC 52180 / NS114) TaxID=471854 RepID=C6W408_DYAFD|nr:efflux RND transporter periplasmic adaptor subunit [Dyadobacter fermentans]ACT92245.1 efflux transporter, RND family, MFP subunit [Dyadobacter fermentans DSM 18053]
MKPYIVLCAALWTCLSCSTGGQQAPDAEAASTPDSVMRRVSFDPAQIRNVGIEVGTPVLKNIPGVVTLQGKIDVPPQSTISLSFPLGGYLKSTTMLPGMRVRKGQVLAELEDMQFIQLQQDYLTAREKLELAQSEFARQEDLNVGKASSDKVLQQAKAEMETQRILMNALARKLEVIGIAPAKLSADHISKTVPILSPIDGFVSRVNVNVGKYTAPTDMLFELVDPKDIHLALHVFEKDLHTLSVGQRVTAYTNGDPSRKFTAKIILIGKSLTDDRLAEVHCHFDRYSPSLVPGMFMNGEVSVSGSKAMSVPEDAVVRWENKSFVFVERESGEFEMVEIVPGGIMDGFQQISAAGIDAASRVVIRNAYSLLIKAKNAGDEG